MYCMLALAGAAALGLAPLVPQRTSGVDTAGNPGCEAEWCVNKMCDEPVRRGPSSPEALPEP